MEKKEKFIYWFIGVGCGIVLSGIMMTFMGLNISKDIPVTVEPINMEDKQTQVEQSKTTVGPIENNEIINEQIEYKWVEIPFVYGATQISNLLKQEDIIEDEKSFLNYLREKKMTTKLRSGMQYLPVKGEYDIILDILTGK